MFYLHKIESCFVFKEQPSYGSGLIFKLHKNVQSGEATVHLYYANVTNNFDIYQLPMNESERFNKLCHQSYCTLSNFERSLSNYLITDEELEKRCTGHKWAFYFIKIDAHFVIQ